MFLSDHSYEYLVEGQPIGRELFHKFCAQDPLLHQCTRFLEEVARLELLVDEKFSASACNTFSQFLANGVGVPHCLVGGASVCVCVSGEGETGGSE